MRPFRLITPKIFMFQCQCENLCIGFYSILLYFETNIFFLQSNFINSAVWFAVLLNFKHIFLYMAPAYVVHLLRAYCFTVSWADGVHTQWYSFSVTNLVKLGTVVLFVFGLSFGPFIGHLPQVIYFFLTKLVLLSYQGFCKVFHIFFQIRAVN